MENLYSLISVWCIKNETEKQKKNALQVNLGHFIKTCATTKTLKDKLLAAGTCWVIMEWMFWYYSCYCKNYVSSAFQHRENMSYETFFLLSVSQFVSQVYLKNWKENQFVHRQEKKNPTPRSLTKHWNVIFEETCWFYIERRQDAKTSVWHGINRAPSSVSLWLKWSEERTTEVTVCRLSAHPHFWVTNIKVSCKNTHKHQTRADKHTYRHTCPKQNLGHFPSATCVAHTDPPTSKGSSCVHTFKKCTRMQGVNKSYYSAVTYLHELYTSPDIQCMGTRYAHNRNNL